MTEEQRNYHQLKNPALMTGINSAMKTEDTEVIRS